MRRIPGIRAITRRTAPPRWLAGGGLALALASVALGCRHDLAAPRKPAEPPEPPACWTLAHVPGPEDLVVDAVNRRLLVSSQDRREKPRPKGAIWSVPLDGQAEPCELELAGREDGCSFHPHGIDLVQSRDGQWLLYVLNHEVADDWSPSHDCFAGAGLPGVHRSAVTSIEVFAVERTRLRFLQRLADPRGPDPRQRPGGPPGAATSG